MPADSPSTPTPPSPKEREALEKLVQGIVVTQGNAFVKELLRSKRIRIGTTKAEFELNMLDAIADGRLTREDIETWLDEVEGWGDQHIYLFNVPKAIAAKTIWKDPAAIRMKVEESGFGKFWNASTSHEFPATMTLTGITFDGQELRLTWHRGEEDWVRDPRKDYTEEIDGDLYKFQAYRYRAWRAVTRFALRLGDRDANTWVAGLFIPVAINSPEHEEILQQVANTLGQLTALLQFGALHKNRVIVADIIRNLDQAKLAGGDAGPKVAAQSTRLSSGGAYVEFAVTSVHDDYGNYGPVRAVRRAIGAPQLLQFTGASGSFEFLEDKASGLGRAVKVEMYGVDRRIRIRRQLTATEVWLILKQLRSFQ